MSCPPTKIFNFPGNNDFNTINKVEMSFPGGWLWSCMIGPQTCANSSPNFPWLFRVFTSNL